MNRDQKILVVYSSGFGSTQEVSEEIARELAKESSFFVVSKSIEQCGDLNDYDVVVVGTSVRADRPLVNARDFVVSHRRELSRKKLAVFLVCITAYSKEGRERVRAEYLPQILQKDTAENLIGFQAFGGKVDFDRLNPIMQDYVRRLLKKVGLPPAESVDARDWGRIRRWASELGISIKNGS